SAMAWFYAAIPVGSALGYVLGGLVGSMLGWKWAFYLVVPPGLLLGLWCFLMREPPRGQADAGSMESSHRVGWHDYRMLGHIPSYVLVTLGMTAMTFAAGGIGVWMPTYVYEREGKVELTDQVMQKLQEGIKVIPRDVLDKLQPLSGQVFPLKEFRSRLKDQLTAEEVEKYREPILDAACKPSLDEINTNFGAIVVVGGLTATLLGGLAGD